ncbi:YesL family protein [Alteribacillus bidgolensis]|uniref:Uncharacterized membrane protein YesL n=1 Tax=Alteribacillus bidgolensis TaxID=930129 RepID=A0A1G8NIP0_9BACI|nr:DUF624 domain-containing protein [Alteribacillus bidgolensis]SDI80119.1 Uncharacterized membrane protein YesL [Alteribacillus bidgolensis]
MRGGLLGGLYQVSEWVSRFAVINLLWLIFNLPIVFVIISMLFAEHTGEVFILTIPLIVLSPFLFFPATAAMFASVRDWVIKKDYISLMKSFWNYYKENYKRSLLGGFILTGLWITWAVEYYYLSEVSVPLMFTFMIMGMVLFVYSINFFSMMAHYHLKLRTLLKKTFIITIGSPVLFLTVLLGSSLIIYVSVNGPLFFIPFFTGSLAAFISFSAFYRLYLKLAEKQVLQK